MYLMKQTMRWFGPGDPVSLRDIRQAGCSGVVTALHQIPVGEVWTVEAIEERKAIVAAEGMTWTVVESLPVSEAIKTRSEDCALHISHYKTSLENLSRCGIEVVTYNFMPILDWLRTDPFHVRPDGTRTLRFEWTDFVIVDWLLLQRPGAAEEYSVADKEQAQEKFGRMSEDQKKRLFDNMLLGLPGSKEAFTPEGILTALQSYEHIDEKQLKENLAHFLQAVIPMAEACGIHMAIHPDDPPYSVLGLPRIVSTEQDLADILSFAPSPANGLCFCTGSLGVRVDNDILGMLTRFSAHIHFVHLRNTARDSEGNFEEGEHLYADTDMVAVVDGLLDIMQRRRVSLPMRPDHGFQMMDDLSKDTYPGYTCIGRMKGLAELRGLELGLAYRK
ncbi:mannonate dehydratase [Reichenbachiella sp. 5M10]|nr:mannonate dehydratase [Reichenbachiella sp. 5M10]